MQHFPHSPALCTCNVSPPVLCFLGRFRHEEVQQSVVANRIPYPRPDKDVNANNNADKNLPRHDKHPPLLPATSARRCRPGVVMLETMVDERVVMVSNFCWCCCYCGDSSFGRWYFANHVSWTPQRESRKAPSWLQIFRLSCGANPTTLSTGGLVHFGGGSLPDARNEKLTPIFQWPFSGGFLHSE